MKIVVNGAPHETSAPDVATLIAELGLEAKSVLVEQNLRALHPREWAELALATGDRIELLRVVAGG